MLNLMEKAWSQYEYEKAAGNGESVDILSDAYTALDMLDMGEDAEQNRDYMETSYNDMVRLAFRREGFQGGPLTDILRGLEEKLVAAGVLEADEEPEAASSATHWDEWMLDQKIDRERDERAAMAYEI